MSLNPSPSPTHSAPLPQGEGQGCGSAVQFAILSAGEGSRLAAEGVSVPKPFVEVGGRALIDRLLDVFQGLSPRRVVVVTNTSVGAYVRRHRPGWAAAWQCRFRDFRLLERDTPSSMHSFHALQALLAPGPFILTTVDTVFRPEEFRRYAAAFGRAVTAGADGLMGVTDFVDDEKPLWVSTDDTLAVTGFHDSPEAFRSSGAAGVCRYVSGGIYGLTDTCLPTLARCIAGGQSRMRNFQRALVADGLRLRAFPFTKIIDVDHAADVAKAEAWDIHAKE